jgi:hypothetical protein
MSQDTSCPQQGAVTKGKHRVTTNAAWAVIATLAIIGILFAAAATANRLDTLLAMSVVAR